MTLSSIYKSLVRSTVDLVDEINTTIPGADVTYHSWESRADEDKLPKNTLLGVGDFMWQENRGLWLTRYSLGLSTYHDANLMNEIDILDIIHARTGETNKINLLDPNTGELLSEMYVVDWELAPMAQSQLRNYRTISLELKRTANKD